ncbi:MAG: porin family protein [Spirochaetia bacterium]|nr:porin family protein [Spirochaetia bacterium]
MIKKVVVTGFFYFMVSVLYGQNTSTSNNQNFSRLFDFVLKTPDSDLFSKYEIGAFLGVSIPLDQISTYYDIDSTTSSLHSFSSKQLSNNINGIKLANSIQLFTLRFATWSRFFGLAFDLGTISYRFGNQELIQTSSGSLNGSQSISITNSDFYQLNKLFVAANVLLRLPIHPNFFPYIGIGAKASVQSISHFGSGNDFYSNVSYSFGNAGPRYFSIEDPYYKPRPSFLDFFHYIIGVEYYISERIGLGLEYTYMTFIKSDTEGASGGYFNYNNGKLGSIEGNGSTSLRFMSTEFRTHTIRLGVIYKFQGEL